MIPNKIYNLSDESLLNSLIINDHKAFEEIFNRYWSRLYFYAYKIIKDKDICEDIIQEIFIDLWSRKNEVYISNLSSYLYKAVKYKILNHFRKDEIEERCFQKWIGLFGTENIEDSLEFKELTEKVEELICKLPEQRRLIFNLSRKENLSHKEIAQKLNISVQTVKNQVSEALKFIRESIKFFMMFF